MKSITLAVTDCCTTNFIWFEVEPSAQGVHSAELNPALRTQGAILEIGLRVSVIPLNVTPQPVLLTLFLGFYSQRVQKPLQRTSTAVFCTKLHLMHRHRHSADQRVKQHCYQLVYRQRVDLRVKCYCTLLRVIMRDERLVVMTCTSELPGNQGFNLLRVKCN